MALKILFLVFAGIAMMLDVLATVDADDGAKLVGLVNGLVLILGIVAVSLTL